MNNKLNINTQSLQTCVSDSPFNNYKKEEKDNRKVPIKRGCPNKECFCSGRCNEIIGWRDKLPNEFQDYH